MCGLVGMAGNVVEQDKKALKYLLRFDSTRGEDSTGLAVVSDKENKIEVHKRVGVPDILFDSNINFDAKGIYCGPRGKVFIGHNRAATRGKVTDDNAHPFEHDGIVGAHNGTLVSASTLEKGNKFEVDSEAIFYNLSQYKPEDVIPKIWGAYALTWYDDSGDTLFIIRNGERPLYWCRRKDKDVFFWASEAWMLNAALYKAGIAHSDPEEFVKNQLYSLDMSALSVLAKWRLIDWENEGEIKGYVPPPPPPKKHNHNVNNIFNHGGGNKSNVVPFSGGKANSSGSYLTSYRSKDEVNRMKMLVDSNIIFRIGDVKTGILSNTTYISAYPDSPMHDYDIRIYANNDKRWDYWLSKKHRTTFIGKVKKVVENRSNGKQEVYFLIDLRSIVERDTDAVVESKEIPIVSDINEMTLFEQMMNSPIEERMYEGFNGNWLTHSEWKACTKNGCAHCSERASEFDANIAFLGHDDFLCGGCVDLYPEIVAHAKSSGIVN